MSYQVIVGEKVCKYTRRLNYLLSDNNIKYSGVKCLNVRCFGFPTPVFFMGDSVKVFGLSHGNSS